MNPFAAADPRKGHGSAPSKPSKPGFEGFEGRDECHWCKIPGRPAASSAAMRATTSAKVGPRLAAVLRLSARTARLCFVLDLDEQLKVHRRVAGEHAGAHRRPPWSIR